MSKSKQTHTKAKNKSIYPAVGIILFLSFIVFSPGLTNEFVNWDDYAYIVDNPILRDFSFSNIAHLFNFKTHVVGNYHPLTVLTNMIEYQLVGVKPALYHFNNILLHLINVFLVSLIVFKLTGKYWATIIATALFAIHPMRVESVVWAAERKDVLYTLFFLLAVYQYVLFVASENKPMRRLIYVFVFFLLSILSKGQAVVLPMVLLLIDYWYDRKFDKKSLLEKVPFFALSVFFGLLATQAQSSSLTEERLVQYAFTDRIFFASYNLLAYPFKLIWPFELACFYGYPLKSEMMSYYLALPAVLLILGILIWKFRKNKPVVFGVLFFLFTIGIVIQLLPIGNAIIADRYTYVPYIGLFILIGLLIDQYISIRPAKSSTVLALTFLVLIVFAGKSYVQAKTWKDSESIWLQVLKVDDKEPIAYNNLGAYYLIKGSPEKAIPLLEAGIVNGEGYLELFKTYNNIGGGYKTLRQYDRSLVAYNKALEIFPNYPDALFGRGLTYTDMKKYNEAIADFTTLLSFDSLNANHYYSRAIAYKGNNQIDKAIEDYKNAIRVNPKYTSAYTNLGNIYFNMQNVEAAIENYSAALAIQPDGNTFLNRAKAYFMTGRTTEALADYNSAVANGVSEPAFYAALQAKR